MTKLNGAELIYRERNRQIAKENFDIEHDDCHTKGELGKAAECYCRFGVRQEIKANAKIAFEISPSDWPWEAEWWKPSKDPIKNLVKAGALIAAEIDRLQRAQK